MKRVKKKDKHIHDFFREIISRNAYDDLCEIPRNDVNACLKKFKTLREYEYSQCSVYTLGNIVRIIKTYYNEKLAFVLHSVLIKIRLIQFRLSNNDRNRVRFEQFEAT